MLERGAVEKIQVWDIVVSARRRRATGEQIQSMRRSLRENGLICPIGVRLIEGGEPELVYGATRLEAAKQEGWREIDAQILSGSDRDFLKAEIIENLHRTELTVQERADWTGALVALCEEELSQLEKDRPGPKGATHAAAQELGIDKNVVYRAVQIAAIAPEAKEAAKEADLDNNQAALLKIAAEPTPEAQVAKVREIAEVKAQEEAARRERPKGPSENPRATELAEFLLERLSDHDIGRLVAMLAFVTPAELLRALAKQPVLPDRVA